jgi:Raf kinase inhibitor-like YbhB/YbcL family protein
MRASFLLAFVLVAACGSDDADVIDAPDDPVDAAISDSGAFDAAVDGAPLDTQAQQLALSSSAITNGGTIADAYSCQGANISPPLAWTGGPAAQGYAIVFTDMTNGLIHSAIWDIPAATTSLAENIPKVAQPAVPAGSKQPLAYDNQTRGYLGPCPGSMHTYQFMLYAVDAYPLPGVTLSSNRTAVRTALNARMVATATLTATFTPLRCSPKTRPADVSDLHSGDGPCLARASSPTNRSSARCARWMQAPSPPTSAAASA